MADTRNGGGNPKANDSTRSRGARKNVTAAATGVAIGIGSAALVAALLYANRPKEDENPVAPDPRFEPRES